MYSRLWWKELRQFWPIWVFVALAAAVTQALALRYLPIESRAGGLFLVALGWASLYGFAIAAAAFAAEREVGTLQLLDVLGLDRPRLWTGKASFALTSTVLLVVVLAVVAATGTKEWPKDGRTEGLLVLSGLALVVEVLGWGLFWSALSGNALTAAALAVCTVGFITPVARGNFDIATTNALIASIPWRLGLGLVAGAASAGLVVRGAPPRASTLGRGQSEFAIVPIESKAPARRARRVHYGMSAFARLIWETIRLEAGTFWRLLVIAWALPLLLSLAITGQGDTGFLLITSIVVGLYAGVRMFGGESAAQTHRLLAHHGVRPSVVWLAKQFVVWSAVAIVLAPAVSLGLLGAFTRQRNTEFDMLSLLLMVNAVAVGQLCGMAVRRTLTAGMLATVVLILVALVTSMIIFLPISTTIGYSLNRLFLPRYGSPFEMAPLLVIGLLLSGLLVIPLAFLFITWAWSGDWLLNRSGWKPWTRLAALVVGTFSLLFGLYVNNRVNGLPTAAIGLEGQLETFLQTTNAGPLAVNAADLYREASRGYTPPSATNEPKTSGYGAVVAIVQDGGLWAKGNVLTKWLDDNAETLKQIEKASEVPTCRFENLADLTLMGNAFDMNLRNLSWLVEVELARKMAENDLKGAWRDLLILFRMARHCSGAVPMNRHSIGREIEGRALRGALEWAVASKGQSAELLLEALRSYRTLPNMPSVAETILAEGVIAENTLESADLTKMIVLGRSAEAAKRDQQLHHVIYADLVTTPWEMARARKAVRYLVDSEANLARLDPFERRRTQASPWGAEIAWNGRGRPTTHYEPRWRIEAVLSTTPLIRSFAPNFDFMVGGDDQHEVARRALVWVLAIRAWQYQHDGKMPRTLDEVQLPELDIRPDDPYTGRPFRYRMSGGQPLRPIGEFIPRVRTEGHLNERRTEGQWLLYSTGADAQDNGGILNENLSQSGGDLIFPLPRDEARP